MDVGSFSKLVFDASASVFRVGHFSVAEGRGYADLHRDETILPITSRCTKQLIAGFDQVTNTLLRVLPTYSISQMRRTVVQVGASYFTTAHDVKVGIRLNHGSLSPYRYSSSACGPSIATACRIQ